MLNPSPRPLCLLPQEGVLLGAVGAYDWNGTVVMHTPGGTVVPGKTQFYDPGAEAGYEGLAGYLGESGKGTLLRSGG